MKVVILMKVRALLPRQSKQVSAEKLDRYFSYP
jgi:hypothetical protein